MTLLIALVSGRRRPLRVPLLGLLLSLANCAGTANSPSEELVRQDLERIAAATRFHRDIFTAEDASFSLDSFEIQGRNEEQNQARLLTLATVHFNGRAPAACCPVTGHELDGLGRFLVYTDAQYSSYKPGAQYRFKVTLIYRRYDTGWHFESYE